MEIRKVRSWSKRSLEVAFLFNPAFCGRILYSTVKAYKEITQKSFPFPLVYLILPLVLHKETRTRINSKTQFQIWIHRYPHLLIGFPQRARDFVQITNEAIEFLIYARQILLTDTGELDILSISTIEKKKKFDDTEILECIQKAQHIAKWFASAGKIETIYIELGVKP